MLDWRVDGLLPVGTKRSASLKVLLRVSLAHHLSGELGDAG
jgi:hypothetical protein